MADPHKPRIYLAGPDVFFPDRQQIFQRLLQQCAALGVEGLAPFDGGPADGPTGTDDQFAQRIYDGNIALLRSADGVVANLSAFRGLEPDSGTVYEVAFAVALGKPVVGYGVPDEPYAARVERALACEPDGQGGLRESGSGVLVEGLGQRLNLMLSRSIELAPTAGDALARLASRFAR